MLRLDEERILVEQLRLLLGNVGTSAVSTFVLAGLLVWTLHDGTNTLGLATWALAVTSSKVLNVMHARRTLARGFTGAEAPQLVWTLMWLNAADGVAWGFLPWVTLDTATLAGAVLVIAVMAGVKSYAMSALSAVFPVSLAFCVFDAMAIGLKLWQMNDPAYRTLALVALLYVGTLIAQSRINSKVTRSVISLRFENLNLIERLREETDKAQTAHRKAEQANLAKSKFLAAASHDLRQPIHAQGLFLEVIGRGELSGIQRDMLNNAKATAKASAEMLNTLLDFSRIEAGVVEPHIQPVGLQTVLNKIENELAPVAVAKGLVYRSRETRLVALCDQMLVELILRNLVSNAIRYTLKGGVLVACRRRGHEVWLEVWDTGIGIEPSQQREVFKEFHQLGNPERDRNKGLGLGLAIVDGLVRVLGHRLTLSSVPDRGSLFRLALPVSDALIVDDVPAVESTSMAPLDLCVLVIDDDAAVRLGMVQLLRDWGCHCVAADTIEEALEWVQHHRPDLLISDYRLRDQRNGAEAIAMLRSVLDADLPALLVTGDTAPDRLRDAQSSGVPLLHKPVTASALHVKLHQIKKNANAACGARQNATPSKRRGVEEGN